jgi:hypothetical protein
MRNGKKRLPERSISGVWHRMYESAVTFNRAAAFGFARVTTL